MDLIYPINFVGHDKWIESGYAFDLASGEVISSDGEVLGSWRVVDYDPEVDNGSGCYEFIVEGTDAVMFAGEFAFLNYRISRGAALSTLSREIEDWRDARPV